MQTRKSPLRTLSVLLTVAVLFGVFACLPVGAAEELTDGDFKYTVENGESTVKEYTGTNKDVTIPSTLGGYPVKAIGDAFAYCDSFTSVIIPESVTKIGSNAFAWSDITSILIPASVTEIGYQAFLACSSLEHITVETGNAYYEAVNDCLIEKSTGTLLSGCKNSVIPDGVKVIGDDAFYYCESLTSVVIPEGVTKIGREAFGSCSALTSVVIPEGVTKIGEDAFGSCSALTSVVIPGSVTEIGYLAFGYCPNLEHITMQSGNAYYEVVNDCLIEKTTDTLLRGCNDSVIPDGVKAIGDEAFDGCDSLTSVVIPNSVTSIGENAFYHCDSLASVIIPDSVTEIGNFAFGYCPALTSVFIPDSVTTMGWFIFDRYNKLTVYCEAEEKPEGWDYGWDDYFDGFDGWIVPFEGTITIQWGCQPPEISVSLGDVNGDGTVNVSDYMMLKRYVLHTFSLTAEQLAVADINADGDVNANDYMILKRAVLGTYKLPSA